MKGGQWPGTGVHAGQFLRSEANKLGMYTRDKARHRRSIQLKRAGHPTLSGHGAVAVQESRSDLLSKSHALESTMFKPSGQKAARLTCSFPESSDPVSSSSEPVSSGPSSSWVSSAAFSFPVRGADSGT